MLWLGTDLKSVPGFSGGFRFGSGGWQARSLLSPHKVTAVYAGEDIEGVEEGAVPPPTRQR